MSYSAPTRSEVEAAIANIETFAPKVKKRVTE